MFYHDLSLSLSFDVDDLYQEGNFQNGIPHEYHGFPTSFCMLTLGYLDVSLLGSIISTIVAYIPISIHSLLVI